MTKTERERLTQIKQRVSTARDRRAAARQALTLAQQSGDNQMTTTARAEVNDAEAELEQLTALENIALSRIATGSAGDRLGGWLLTNIDAQQAPAEIAASSAPIRASIHVGTYMTADDVAGLTGRMLAAPVDMPDTGGRVGFAGIAPTPQAPLTLLDFFGSVPFDSRTVDLLRRSGVADAAIQVAGTVKHEARLSLRGRQPPDGHGRVVDQGKPPGPPGHRGAAGRHRAGVAVRRARQRSRTCCSTARRRTPTVRRSPASSTAR